MTTEETPGMTLVEELELAARDCDITADYFASPMAGARTRGAAEMKARAARLRARAERVREIGEALEADRAKEVSATSGALFARPAPFLNGRQAEEAAAKVMREALGNISATYTPTIEGAVTFCGICEKPTSGRRRCNSDECPGAIARCALAEADRILREGTK